MNNTPELDMKYLKKALFNTLVRLPLIFPVTTLMTLFVILSNWISLGDILYVFISVAFVGSLYKLSTLFRHKRDIKLPLFLAVGLDIFYAYLIGYQGRLWIYILVGIIISLFALYRALMHTVSYQQLLNGLQKK
jgi:hypothetical protein